MNHKISSHFQLKRQKFGFILAIISLAISIYFAATELFGLVDLNDRYARSRKSFLTFFMTKLSFLAISSIYTAFYSTILLKRDYLMGKPQINKFWPLAIAILCSVTEIFNININSKDSVRICVSMMNHSSLIILAGFVYLMYSQSDFGKSYALFLKPYVMISAEMSKNIGMNTV